MDFHLREGKDYVYVVAIVWPDGSFLGRRANGSVVLRDRENENTVAAISDYKDEKIFFIQYPPLKRGSPPRKYLLTDHVIGKLLWSVRNTPCLPETRQDVEQDIALSIELENEDALLVLDLVSSEPGEAAESFELYALLDETHPFWSMTGDFESWAAEYFPDADFRHRLQRQ